MVKVNELVPGQIIELGGRKATFIVSTEHPFYKKLAFVVWRMDDRSWSHDALDWNQDVGDVVEYDSYAQEQHLFQALHN